MYLNINAILNKYMEEIPYIYFKVNVLRNFLLETFYPLKVSVTFKKQILVNFYFLSK